MKKHAHTAFAIAIILLAGCRENSGENKAGLSEKTYEASDVHVSMMTFPAGSKTIFKPYAEFKESPHPQPYRQPNTWVVYMAAPGWTNGGLPIEDRVASDASAVYRVNQFIQENRLRDKVKVAWIQYDENPSPQYVENLDIVPENFIPLFLKPHGPYVDFYIYSPATRYRTNGQNLSYDQWLKPYLPFAKKVGNDYVASTFFHENAGFNDTKGKYWNSWARHWFIVNPKGEVVDAYFSNLGSYKIQGADKPINSLIHHLDLDANNLVIPKIVNANYDSYYTAPYWNKVDAEFREKLGVGNQ